MSHYYVLTRIEIRSFGVQIVAAIKPSWIKRRFGWIVCLVSGHVPSRRRARVSPDNVYTSVCRRCEAKMERRDGKWRIERLVRN